MAMMSLQSMYRPIAASLLIDPNCVGKGRGTQCPGLFIFIHLYRSLMPTRPDYTRYYLVLRQGYIDGFSWPVRVQGKARLAVNGNSPLQKAQRRHEP